MDEQSIFLEALSKSAGNERLAWLNDICGRNGNLRQRIDALLRRHEQTGSFLERPLVEFDATRSPAESTPDRAGEQQEGLTAFSDAEQSVATGTAGQTVLQCPGHRGELRHVLKGHPESVKFLACNADGQRIDTGSGFLPAGWDVENGRELLSLRHGGAAGGIGCAAFCPDGTRIATDVQDGTAKVWNATIGQEPKSQWTCRQVGQCGIQPRWKAPRESAAIRIARGATIHGHDAHTLADGPGRDKSPRLRVPVQTVDRRTEYADFLLL